MKTKFTLFFKVAIFALVGLISTNTYGQTRISDEAGLRAIANDLAGDYILDADITLTEEWIPIGDENNRFMGVIDGNGKTIYGLKFKDTTRDGAGFIGVADGAVVKNLSIMKADVYGGQDVGLLIGRAYAPTTVMECFTSGIARGYDHVGGLIGGTMDSDPEGEVSNIESCFSTAIVESTSWQAGGLLGISVNTDIVDSYFAGVAFCELGSSGGIVALLDGGSTKIENSVVLSAYLKGTEDSHLILGRKGEYTVLLKNNYSWEGTELYWNKELSNEEIISDPEGLDGEVVSLSQLKSASFYTSTLSWSSSAWKIEDGKLPVLSYQSFPLDADFIFVPEYQDMFLPGNIHELGALSSLGRTLTYSSSDTSIASVSEDGTVTFTGTGTVTITITSAADETYGAGSVALEMVSENISYEIRTERDLRNIKYDLEGDFTLMNNITVTGEWEPISEIFKGTFNGNGKIIYGLTYNDPSKNDIGGLFTITEGATISKLGIEKANIVANQNVGAIAGRIHGTTISECYVANSYIAGRDHVGSLVGDITTLETKDEDGDVIKTDDSTVSDCHSGAHVYSREFQAGGIVGIIRGGFIQNCYFSGLVESKTGRAAGIISFVDSDDAGEVRNNLNLAAAIYCLEGGTYRIGDFGERAPGGNNYSVKFRNNWSVLASYMGENNRGSGKLEGANAADDDRNGQNLTFDNLARTQSFYTGTLGWDFNSKWKFISGTEGKMYPVLQWQEAPLVSTIYGIPSPAYLIWNEGENDDTIDLGKIIASYGQSLTITSDENFVEISTGENLLYATEDKLTAPGTDKISITVDPSVSDLSTIITPLSFDVEVIPETYVYEISTTNEFVAINNKLFANYRLTANIPMYSKEFYGIGSEASPFVGNFDGNGYTVFDPTIITESGSVKGLFNATNGATIKNLLVANINFSGSTTGNSECYDIGGLIGKATNTTIDQCGVMGTIIGHDHVGGIAGNATKVTIRNSYTNVTVQTARQGSGFFGVTSGDKVVIENCYFAGSVNNEFDYAGGFIGLIDKEGEISISGSVSIGDINGANTGGPFIGSNGLISDTEPKATISLFVNNLYNWDAIEYIGDYWTVTETSNSIQYPEPKSPEELKKQSTYSAISWDFNNIWFVEEEGVTYPELFRSFINVEEETIKTKEYVVYASNNDIHISGIEATAAVAIYNLNGQIVSQSIVTNDAILPVSDKGFYIVKIVEEGETTTVKVISK